MKKYFITFTILSANLLGYAQIETDRPDFTESPNVVPAGALQVETGFIYSHGFDQAPCTDIVETGLTLNTSLFRYGINEKTELRLNWSVNQINRNITNGGSGEDPCLLVIIDEDSSYTGLSPIFIGIKRNLHQGENVSVGFLAHMYLPFTGTSGFEASRFAPEFLLPVIVNITDRFSIAVQLGMSWDGDDVAPIGNYTLSMAYGITDKLGIYVEPYGYKNYNHNATGDRDGRINGGFTFLVNDNFQLDVSSGVYRGETGSFTDYFVGCGLSYIYQK